MRHGIARSMAYHGSMQLNLGLFDYPLGGSFLICSFGRSEDLSWGRWVFYGGAQEGFHRPWCIFAQDYSTAVRWVMFTGRIQPYLYRTAGAKPAAPILYCKSSSIYLIFSTFMLYSIVLHFVAEARPFRDPPIYSTGRSTSVAGRGRLA